jgi:large subunit ribosomal protein L10
MITKKSKEKVMGDLKESFSKSNAVFLTNIIGMPSNDSVLLRKELRKSGGKLVIARNTLIRAASKEAGFGDLFNDLRGPSALVFSFEDPTVTSKVILDASKNFELIVLRGGYLGQKQLSAAETLSLAKLPGRNQMLATLLATFNAPVSAFVRVLDAILQQKQGGASQQ